MKLNFIVKRIALALSITGLFYLSAIAQDMSKEKCETTIELTYFKKTDQTKFVTASVRMRGSNKKFVAGKNAKVNFYIMVGKELQLLTSQNTDSKGKVIIKLPKNMPLDENQSFAVYAKIENDKMYEDVEEHIRFKEANLTFNLNPKDTAHVAIAKVTETGKDGKEIPVKDVELKFYVQRLFGMMPAGEDCVVKTDEKGEASYIFPKDLPGDTAGIVIVAAKMEDNESYGTVENRTPTEWGVKLTVDKSPFARALFEPKAPLALILSISITFACVWLTYFFIFFLLYQISKDKKITANN